MFKVVMSVLSSQSKSALALELGVLCSISKSPSKLLSKSWLGLAPMILTLSLSRYPYNTTYQCVCTWYLGYSWACCTWPLNTHLCDTLAASALQYLPDPLAKPATKEHYIPQPPKPDALDCTSTCLCLGYHHNTY